jgi:hypothetical protein
MKQGQHQLLCSNGHQKHKDESKNILVIFLQQHLIKYIKNFKFFIVIDQGAKYYTYCVT